MSSDQHAFPGLLAACGLTVVAAWTPFFWWELLKGPLDRLAAVGVAWLLGYGLVGLLAARQVPPPRAQRLGLVPPAWRHWLHALLLLPALPLGFELQAVNRLLWGHGPAAGIFEWSHRLLATGSGWAQVENVLIFGVVLPALVEWFFRGLVQQGLVSRLGSLKGLVVTSVLYALAIAGLGGEPSLWAGKLGASLLWGLLLGLLRLGSGSLLPPLALHAGFSLVWLWSLARVEQHPVAAFTAPGVHLPALVLVPAFVSVTVAVALLWREARRASDGRG